jgi:hypothetical protein
MVSKTQTNAARVLKTKRQPADNAALEFAPIDIELDIARDQAQWDALFVTMQASLRFCQFDHLQAQAAMARTLENGFEDAERIITTTEERIEFMKSALAIVEAGHARMLIGLERAVEAM